MQGWRPALLLARRGSNISSKIDGVSDAQYQRANAPYEQISKSDHLSSQLKEGNASGSYEASQGVQCPICQHECSVFDLRCSHCNTDLSTTTFIRRIRSDDVTPDAPEIRFAGSKETLRPGAIIGRAGLARSVLEADLTVSRRHIEVLRIENRWFLKQLPNTRSACLFDGTPIAAGEVVEITQSEHTLQFNSITVEVGFPKPERQPDPPAPDPGDGKEVASEYHALADRHLDHLLVALNTAGKIVWSTQEFRKRFLDGSEEAEGESFLDMIHEQERAQVEDALSDPPFDLLEHRMRGADGTWRYVESTGRLCKASSESNVDLLVYCRDITTRKDYELEIRRRGMQLLDQGKSLFQLSGSQEFRKGEVSLCYSLATEASCRAIRADRVAVWTQKTPEGPLECQDVFDQSSREHGSGEAVSWHGMREVADECLLSGILSIEDVTSSKWDELRASGFLHGQSRSVLFAPIKWSGELFGAVSFERFPPDQHPWTNEDQNYAALVAGLIEIAYERQELRRTHQETSPQSGQPHTGIGGGGGIRPRDASLPLEYGSGSHAMDVCALSAYRR